MGSTSMDYNLYIFGSYIAAFLMVGGLILHTLFDARRVSRALREKTRHET